METEVFKRRTLKSALWNQAKSIYRCLEGASCFGLQGSSF